MSAKRKRAILFALLLLAVILLAGCSSADARSTTAEPLGGLLGSRSETLDILGLLTLLTLLPSILIMFTSFTRIIIVLSFVRNALGLQQMPPNQVLVGIALILTFFVMSPVLAKIDEQAYQPYVANEISQEEAVEKALEPVRDFMFRQTFKEDLKFFQGVASVEAEKLEDVPTEVLMPAFVTSEIKRAFQIGFLLYIPFIVIDMIVASALMSMGMMMLPPTIISLPFKVLLFVLVDGWMLTVQTLVTGFG
ncbi:MAG: flagellar type III secretion system pore protein FliP [Christensenellales bacterium]|nr:flagellar type III secretion system pore protein FliP [Clostridiales bacterium]